MKYEKTLGDKRDKKVPRLVNTKEPCGVTNDFFLASLFPLKTPYTHQTTQFNTRGNMTRKHIFFHKIGYENI